MMYMPDCLKATLDLIEAPSDKLRQRVYNVQAFSFSPAELEKEIQKWLPSFRVEYQPDFRQKIAESWPESLDDSRAREDWGWKEDYDLSSMVEVMLHSK